ncbi:MAG: DUF1835 domain-containing protein [Fulvivirga sp.]
MKPIDYHILNGDALKAQFPEEIPGEIIVMRECLIEGPVAGRSIEEILDNRARFITNEYGGTEDEYHNTVGAEVKRISAIPADSVINLWFEDDLFCQVNLWFLLHLLKINSQGNVLYLVRPKTQTQYGFGAYKPNELPTLLSDRIKLESAEDLSKFWSYYQSEELSKLRQLANQLSSDYPFLLPAVAAHIERIPDGQNLGRPINSLVAIIKELKTKEFGPVFREFSKRESIYGFGDLQVKRLFDKAVEQSLI